MMLIFLLQRLAEKTTWYGLTALLTAAGITVAPDVANAVTATGVSIAGLIGILTKD